MDKFFKQDTVKGLFGLCLALFILFCFYYRTFKPVELEDIWWHLATGRWITQNSVAPTFDIFAINNQHTIPGLSPQWLGSYLLFQIYDHFGFMGLKCFRMLMLILPPIFLIIWSIRRKVPKPFIFCFAFFMLEALLLRSHLRPYLFNHSFIILWLMCLFRFYQKQSLSLIGLVLFMLMVWRNIHMGFFVYGGSTLFLFSICRFVTILKNSPSSRADEWKVFIMSFAVLCGLYVFAWIVNPYGWEGVVYPIKVFLDPDFINFYGLKTTVAELSSAWGMLRNPSSWWIWSLFGMVALVILCSTKEKLLTITLFLFAGLLFVYAKRAIGFFTLISIFSLIIVLKHQHDALMKRWIVVAYLIIVCFIGRNIILIKPAQALVDGQTKPYKTLEIDPFIPKKSLAFLEQQGRKGVVFNSAIYGSYMLWSNYPDLRPFIDTRQYNPQLWQNYHIVLSNFSRNWDSLVEQYSISMALLNTNYHATSYRLIKHLQKHPHWQLAHLDGPHAIFIKGDCLKQKELCEYQTQLSSQTLISSDLQKLAKFQNLQPTAKRIIFHANFLKAYALLEMGYDGASLKAFIEAFDEGFSPDQQRLVPAFVNHFQESQISQ